MTTLSILIPANDEAAYIERCLDALLAQPDDPALAAVEIVVAANGCTDDTVARAEGRVARAEARGWRLEVLDIAEGGKLNALDAAERVATGRVLVYLDADVVCGPGLPAALVAALDHDTPAYATGRLQVARARSWVTRRYADLWTRLPFVTGGAVGAGLFAVNRAGRARWGAWPRIISDDTFARLNFAPHERTEVAPVYVWPMVEGFENLVRVRVRQDAGVEEVREKFPPLAANEVHGRVGAGGLLRLAASAPVALAVYVAVALAVKRRKGPRDNPDRRWQRGR